MNLTLKTKACLEQIFMFLLLNYLVLIYDGLLFQIPWSIGTVLMLCFLLSATLLSLFTSLQIRHYTKATDTCLTNYNISIYLCFLDLLLFRKCLSAETAGPGVYLCALGLLVMVVFFATETFRSYRLYLISRKPVMISGT